MCLTFEPEEEDKFTFGYRDMKWGMGVWNQNEMLLPGGNFKVVEVAKILKAPVVSHVEKYEGVKMDETRRSVKSMTFCVKYELKLV